MNLFNRSKLHLLDNPEIKEYSQTIDGLYKVSQLPNLKGKTAIDIGAHAGLFALNIARKTGCKVHAYEPHPDNYRNLVEHIRMNKLQEQIWVFMYAVWENKGVTTMSVDPSKDSSDSHTLTKMEDWKSTSVFTITSGEIFFRARGIISYLKVNCEGGEYYVLKYLVKHPQDLNRIERMCIEIHPNMLAQGQLEEIATWLEQVKQVVPKIKVMFAGSFAKGISQEVIEGMKVDTL